MSSSYSSVSIHSNAYFRPISCASPSSADACIETHANGRRSCVRREFLGDKDFDNDDSAMSVFTDDEVEQSTVSMVTTPSFSPISAAATPVTTSNLNYFADENLESFTCPYFSATAVGGIEQATPIIAAAMKLTADRLAKLVAVPAGAEGPRNRAAMRVCQSTIVPLVPISFSRNGTGSSISLALHVPSLSLMTVKIVTLTDNCIKGEVEYINAWAERTVRANSSGDNGDASAPTLQFYGAFPSAKHNALVFVYEYMHRGSLASSLEEGMEAAVASESFINGLAFSLLSGLRTLSDEGYMHGDIKPSNILVSPAGFCIADFGSLRSVAPVSL